MSPRAQSLKAKRTVARPRSGPVRARAKAEPEADKPQQQNGMESLGIAGRVRHARLARGARLKDVALAAGCSESLISKIENRKINPSLNVLHRICEALSTTIGELLSVPGENGRVVTPAEQRLSVEFDSLRQGAGYRMERLIPHAKGHLLQGSIHVIAPGGSTDGVVCHDGEEVGYVIAGEIELTVGGVTYRAKAGDSFCYRSELPHGHRNIGEGEARVLFVNTPPSF